MFVGILLLFYATQFGAAAQDDIRMAESGAVYNPFNPLLEVPPDAESYGTRPAEIPEMIMPTALALLSQEYMVNEFVCYPIGFYKVVRLSDADRRRVAQIITECAGQPPESIAEKVRAAQMKFAEAHDYINLGAVDYTGVLDPAVDYATFRARMEEVDRLLGGRSQYAAEDLMQYGRAAVTYEEKLEQRRQVIEDDRVTGAYARLFCDYTGIDITLFSIFVPVAFLMRDRRTRVSPVLYARPVSSVVFVGARYCAVTAMILLPVLLLSLIPLAQLAQYGARAQIDMDLLAFVKYIFAWILPTILLVTSVGFFLTILTDTPIAIAVQFIWSFVSIFTTVGSINGGSYGLSLTIRHNSIGNLTAVLDHLPQLVLNRAFYTVLALVLFVLAVVVYDIKRKGMLDIGGFLRKSARLDRTAASTHGAG